ncbi:hypothetical protein AMECASPLE_009792 [Ameca splendens]|uniref:Uncharacterized protein n=1 Tax=Ameca splendens TaxID=208324 RepID=A0ABV0YC91_9TELE
MCKSLDMMANPLSQVSKTRIETFSVVCGHYCLMTLRTDEILWCKGWMQKLLSMSDQCMPARPETSQRSKKNALSLHHRKQRQA